MKDWTDITANLPQDFGSENLSSENLGLLPSGVRVPSALALGFQIIAALLAGLCGVFGLSRWEKEAHRDRAYRVRGAVASALLDYDTAVNNAEVSASWSGERYVWWMQMKAVWVDPDDDIHNRRPRAATLFDKPFRGHRQKSRSLIPACLEIWLRSTLRQISRQIFRLAGQDNHIIKPPP